MAAVLISAFAATSPAQTTPGPVPAAAASDDGLITLNFPENLELKTLVDYVSRRMGFNVSYEEEQLSNQRVTIVATTKVPASALPDLLQSMLKTRGLAIVEGDQPGWKKIVSLATSAVPTSRPAAGPGAAGAGTDAGGRNQPVAQVFALQNADAQRVDSLLKPFLSGPASSSAALAEQRAVLVVDYASNMPRLGELIRLLDQPNRSSNIVFIPVRNADATQLAPQVKQILLAKVRAQSSSQGGQPGSAGESVEVTQDQRTNQLVVVGPQALVEEAARVSASLDVVVTEQQSPVRFYKLANATAADVLDTLRALEGEGGAQGGATSPGAALLAGAASPRGSPRNAAAPYAAAVSPASAGVAGASPQGVGASLAEGDTGTLLPRSGSPAGGGAGAGAEGAPGAVAAPAAVHTRRATIAADTNTNTLIVVAEPAVQKVYELLIRNLDKRRPQVLIEATVVELDTSRGFKFGVELSGHSRPGGRDQAITFSSFGLSTPNPNTGQLALIPGIGFNGALISSDIADVILRALSSSGRARVSSAPRILVNDNATGTLQSLSEQPFTSTNIGTSLSTTSFAGYAEAGTEITLTPHISEADYLQLEYQVALSSFTGSGNSTQGVPPPRQKDSVQSKVTIPDGSTVIVGGLNRSNFNKTVDAVPFLGQIPILGLLFSNRDVTEENLTLFVFLRPVILRDDQFEDLKFLSAKDVKTADVSDGFPASAPLPVH